MDHAFAERGVKELLGQGSNPRVLEYLRTTTLPAKLAADDETPWCSAFVNWCVTRSGLKGTDSAAARSWLTWGQPLEVPRRGCVAVLSRAGGGHVGFYLRTVGSTLHLFGGNQNNLVGTRAYDRSRLLGYRIAA
jgi:uncharacterized protein (TIGR02594 family)